MPTPGQAPGLPYPIGNAYAPIAQCPVDPITGAVTVGGVVNYTPISTVGTTTLKATQGVFFGLVGINTGTTYAAAVYDIYSYYTTTIGTATQTLTGVPGFSPLATSTVTNTFLPSAAITAGGAVTVAGVGLRSNGAMVVVTTGTAGLLNALWD